MQIALFITCVNDTLFPEAGRATVRVLERLGHRVEFPEQQTCCGQMHANSGYEAEAIPLVTRFVRTFSPDRFDAVVSPSGSCVAMVRHHYPRLARQAGDPGLEQAVAALTPRVFELSEFLHSRARGRGRRRLLPAPRRLSPELPRATDAARHRGAAGAAAPGSRDRPRGAARGAVLLRIRRHVRGQERRHIRGDARRQDPLDPRHARGGLHRARQLVPDAHRRRAVASARRRAHRSLRRDPRHRGTITPRATGEGGFPEAARHALRDAQLRHNLRHATHTIRDKRAAAVAEVDDWEQLREAGRADQGRRRSAISTLISRRSSAASRRRAARSTGRPTPPRPTGSSPGWSQAAGASEVVKVKSIATDEIGLGRRRSRRRGITSQETDLAELIIQLAGDRPRTSWCRRSTATGPRSAQLFRARAARHRGADRRAGRARRGRAPLPAREVPVGRRWRSAAPISRSPRPAPWSCVESEGNGRMCTTLPRTLITVMGIEKVLPRLARPRGDAAAAAALVDRRADEPVHVAVDRGDAGRRAAGVPSGAARRRAHRRARATRSGAQALHCIRCSACLNVCPVYERTGGHAYGSVYPGPIGAILTPQLAGLAGRHRRCRGPLRCAAPATTSARSRSTSRACSSTCAARVVREHPEAVPTGERAAMRTLASVLGSRRALRAGSEGRARWGRGHCRATGGSSAGFRGRSAGWTAARDLPAPPKQTFREWWRERGGRRRAA